MRISDWSSDVCSSDLPIVARDSGAAIAARRGGVVDQVDATSIVIRATEDLDAGKSGVDIYRLQKFQRSNQNTCVNPRPLVDRESVEAGKSVSVRVDLGGRRTNKKTNNKT